MRAVSENVVRAPMATVDLWRAIESLACENWTEEAIASAWLFPVRQIRKLRLLATVHPAILDQIGAGDMPKEADLRTIASAPAKTRPPHGRSSSRSEAKARPGGRWFRRSRRPLLRQRREIRRGRARRVRDRLAGRPVRRSRRRHRFTIDGEAFVSAQRAWLDAHLPKNGVFSKWTIWPRKAAAESAAHLGDNSRVFNHRFLMSQHGGRHYLAALKFRCRRRGARRYRLRIVADSLGEAEPLKMQHFRGVYEKFLD